MGKKRLNFSIAQNILIFTILIVVLSLSTVTVSESLMFSNSTFSVVEDTSKEINRQIILNYQNYIESVIDTANYIQQKTIEYGLIYRENELDEVYNNASEIQEDIVSIILIDLSGNVVVSSTNQEITSNDLTLKDWYIDALDDSTRYHFSSPHPQDIIKNSSEEVITVTKIIDYYIGKVKYTGVLVVDLNTSNLRKLSETTNLGEGGHVIILNVDDTLVYSSSPNCRISSCESSLIVQDIIFGGEKVAVDGVSMYANVNTLDDTRWRIGTFINVDIIDQTRQQTVLIAFVIFTVTLVFTVFASTLISRRISRPISKLQKHMKLVEKGNLYKKINIDGQKEVVELGHSFNRMQEEIRALMETVLIEQKEKRKTEFIALQTQINPHFLYNTLDSIVYLSENGLNEKVQEMVVALSKFFRISISRGKSIIPVSEELEHARNYLLIQQIRYHEKFNFIFDIAEDTKSLKIVKLVLQPIIENAIYHGINTEYQQGLIIIRSFLKDEKLIIEIEDDGYGIPDEKIKQMYENMTSEENQTSIGLRNVYQRIKIYYGDEAEFIIDSELDERTIIRLVIPIERAK